MKLKTWLLPAAALAISLSVAPAWATTWNFSYTSAEGLDTTASGTFETAGTASSPEEVTSISGTYTEFGVSYTIVGVADLTDNTVPFFYDNLFSATEPYFDLDGLVFYIGDDVNGDPLFVNLASDGKGGYLITESDTVFVSNAVSLTVTASGDTTPPPAIPEPSSMALMLAGLGLASMAALKRRQR